MRLGPFHLVSDAALARQGAPVVHIAPDADQAANGLFALIAAVTEWRDARQPCLDSAGASMTREDRQKRLDMWSRYSKAESALMAVARKLGREVPR